MGDPAGLARLLDHTERIVLHRDRLDLRVGTAGFLLPLGRLLVGTLPLLDPLLADIIPLLLSLVRTHTVTSLPNSRQLLVVDILAGLISMAEATRRLVHGNWTNYGVWSNEKRL